MTKRTIFAIKHQARILNIQRQDFSAVYQLDLIDCHIIKKYNKITDVEQDGFSHTAISQVCKRKSRTSGGFLWCYCKDYSSTWEPPILSFLREEPIYCIELQKIFNNRQEASKELNIPKQYIDKAINGLAHQAGGLHFCYVKDKDNYVLPTNKDEHAVVCINTGIHYSCIAEASRLTNTNAAGISACCRGRNKTANNLSWCYEENYATDLKSKIGKNKAVICIELKQFFSNTSIASQKLEVNRNSISPCCNHKPHYNTVGGYHWRWATEEEIKQQKYIEQERVD